MIHFHDPSLLDIGDEKLTYCCWKKSGSPVELGSLSQYLQGCSTIPGGCLGFLKNPKAQACQGENGNPRLEGSTWRDRMTILLVGCINGFFQILTFKRWAVR